MDLPQPLAPTIPIHSPRSAEKVMSFSEKKDIYIKQVKEMANIVYSYGLNIDYFPTNFIVQDDLIYYIDYECNQYMDEWNLENWGIKYWYKTNE